MPDKYLQGNMKEHIRTCCGVGENAGRPRGDRKMPQNYLTWWEKKDRGNKAERQADKTVESKDSRTGKTGPRAR